MIINKNIITMKKIVYKLVLGIFFTLFCTSLNAQEYQYIPMVKSGLQIWTNDFEYYEQVGQDLQKSFIFNRYALTNEDTIIQNETYKKLYSFTNNNFDVDSAICIGGIRENAQRQVYYKDGSLPIRLLCDFSLSVGDTFSIPNTCTFEVKSIDTIDYEGVQRRKYTIWGASGAVVWIEGIGNYEGLLFDMWYRCASVDPDVLGRIRCYEHNGALLYHNYSYGIEDCITPLVGLNDIEKQIENITIYPNPAREDISFSSSLMIKRIEIYDIMGKKVYSLDINNYSKTINVSSFNKGIYIARLNTEQGLVSKKFIVE
ncbi:MAG: hypothetical protein H6Q15_1495 [Bacteroidetes bacterium]|nr:hypothetical protein [Bacteroidota bacterium]